MGLKRITVLFSSYKKILLVIPDYFLNGKIEISLFNEGWIYLFPDLT